MTTPHRQDDGMTPTRFVNDLLSACDPSNWDADCKTGDYYRGVRDAYEAVHKVINKYQSAMSECTRANPASRDGAEGTGQRCVHNVPITHACRHCGHGRVYTLEEIKAERAARRSAQPQPAPDALRICDGDDFLTQARKTIGHLSHAVDALSAAPVPPADGDRISFPRWWIQNIRDGLFAIGGEEAIPPHLAKAINDLSDYADDLDLTERPAEGDYDVTKDIRLVCQSLIDTLSPAPVRGAIARALFKNRSKFDDRTTEEWFRLYAENPKQLGEQYLSVWWAYSDADALLQSSPAALSDTHSVDRGER